jgi:hypothetical protein
LAIRSPQLLRESKEKAHALVSNNPICHLTIHDSINNKLKKGLREKDKKAVNGK